MYRKDLFRVQRFQQQRSSHRRVYSSADQHEHIVFAGGLANLRNHLLNAVFHGVCATQSADVIKEVFK